jgi:hypothetical protein
MLTRLSEVGLGVVEWSHGSWPEGVQEELHSKDRWIRRGFELIVRVLFYLDISSEIRDVRSFFLPTLPLPWHMKQPSPGSRHSSSRVLMNEICGRMMFGW